jgi:hypothetical protein
MSTEVSPEPAVTPAPAAPTVADATKAIDMMSTVDLDALLGDAMKPAVPPAAVEPSPAPTVPAEPTSTPSTTPPATKEELANHWRMHVDTETPEGRKEAAVYALRKAGKTLEEAYATVYGPKNVEPPKPVTPPQPADPGAEFDTKITSAQTELTALETALNKAIDEGDNKAQSDALRAINRKEREIERLGDQKAKAVQQAQTSVSEQEENTFRQKAVEASRQGITEFPQFAGPKPGEEKSADRLALEHFIETKRADPDYDSIFLSPRWPLILIRDYASSKGLKPSAGSPPPAPAPARATPRAPAAEIITPATSTMTFVPTRESLLKAIDKMNVKELDAYLGVPSKGK